MLWAILVAFALAGALSLLGYLSMQQAMTADARIGGGISVLAGAACGIVGVILFAIKFVMMALAQG